MPIYWLYMIAGEGSGGSYTYKVTHTAQEDATEEDIDATEEDAHGVL